MRRLALALFFVVVFAFPAHAAELPGTIVRGFEAPAHSYGPGHRGIAFETEPGSPVVAVADGVVTFAGTVAHRKYVSVREGRRTVTYAYLASITVQRGQRVRVGEPVGATYGRWHLGLRIATQAGTWEYVDPLTLFGGPPRVHLVPLNAAKRTDP